tara:strand:+ start:485 stop:1396 length:912 start_codon:yes stop_codon:yes gene_type:complete
MKNIFINALKDQPFVIADIGAAGGLDDRWSDLGSSITPILFEPEKEAYEDLIKVKQDNYIIMKKALYKKKKTIKLYICRKAEVSSIYKPNMDLTNNFHNPERFEILGTDSLEADTLSNQLKQNDVKKLDFKKIDTQGSELEILQGCDDLFVDLIGIEAEVEFSELYIGQPLFSDVHNYISNKGFTFYDIKRYYWKRRLHNRNIRNKGQLIFGDALYVKSPEEIVKNISSRTFDDRVTYITKALYVYISYGLDDLALKLLSNSSELISENKTQIKKYIRNKIKKNKYIYIKNNLKNLFNVFQLG